MQNIVRHYRLINGEEIIGEFINETDYNISIKNPMTVIELPEMITLSKYIPFSENQIVNLKKIHIITLTELHPEMIRYYFNTLEMSKISSEKSLVGLKNVNEQMEEYMNEYTNNSSFQNTTIENDSYLHSNTIH